MKTRTLGILLRKEVWLMMRNPFIPKIIIALPFMAMLILPLVANLDVRNVGVAVVDTVAPYSRRHRGVGVYDRLRSGLSL